MRERGRRDEYGLRGVIAGARRSGNPLGEIINQHIMGVDRRRIGARKQAIDDVDDGTEPCFNTGFFAQFAQSGVRDPLAPLDFAARDRPGALHRRAAAPHQEHAVALKTDDPDARNRAARRIFERHQ